MATERVQKILAQVGIASRRKAEELIRDGLVTVNGKVIKLGDKAELGTDSIKVNGKLIQRAETPTYLAFYKPKNVISMLTDPQDRPSLAGYLTKIHARLFPVGRLDFTSEGIILLTNDGAFAEKLQRQTNIPRVYQVKVKGHPNREMLSRLERGSRAGGRLVKPHSVRICEELTSKSMIEIVFIGAGAVDVKAFIESRGFSVERMIRTAIGHITIRGMKSGEYRLLKASQVEALLKQPELGMRLLEPGEREAAQRDRSRLRDETRAAEREEARLKAEALVARPSSRPLVKPVTRAVSRELQRAEKRPSPVMRGGPGRAWEPKVPRAKPTAKPAIRVKRRET